MMPLRSQIVRTLARSASERQYGTRDHSRFACRVLAALCSVALSGQGPWEGREHRVAKSARAPEDIGLSQITLIDGQIRRRLSDAGFVPSPPATDGQWCRRL